MNPYAKARAVSSTYTNGSASADNTVVVFPAASDAIGEFAAFKTTATRRCLAKTLPKTLPAALAAIPQLGKVSRISVTVTPGTTATPGNGSYETVATVKLKTGKTAVVYVNSEALQVDRAIDTFQFVNIGAQLDGIHDHLIASSAGRLQASLGLTAPGEDAVLAGLQTPVPGYIYKDVAAADLKPIADALADPKFAQVVSGRSLHEVIAITPTGPSTASIKPVGFIEMVDFTPQYANQPSFKDSTVIDEATSAGSLTEFTTKAGRIVGKATTPTGATACFFFSQSVLLHIFSNTNPADADSFVNEYLARTPI